MRVIAGEFRSRRLRTLPGRHVRPMPNRLRETLFDILQPHLPQSTFIDAYAGSGAVGIEALSRGAAKVFFLEKHRAALAVIRENLKALGVGEEAEVVGEDACTGLESLARRGLATDICFLGPPYTAPEEYDRALGLLGRGKVIRSGGVVIAQHTTRQELGDSYGVLRRSRTIRQGTNALSFYEPD